MKIAELILQYIASPDTKNVVADEISRCPDEALQTILAFRGPYPKDIHPIDVHEIYLTDLVTALLKRCPRLLAGPDPAQIPLGNTILIASAIAANDPRFAETILAGLKHRSIYVKLAAVHGIIRCGFLRTPEVKRQLAALMVKKSIANSEYLLARFQVAFDAF